MTRTLADSSVGFLSLSLRSQAMMVDRRDGKTSAFSMMVKRRDGKTSCMHKLKADPVIS